MKKKQNLNRAQRELAAAEEAMLKRWATLPKFARTPKPPASVPKSQPPQSTVEQRRSLMTPGGSTALKLVVKYTGTAMLGIATMHKSNAIPVFDSKTAVEVSSMRRG